jgi:hypothetical protein
MPPSCHPCIDVSEWESRGGLSHHPAFLTTQWTKGQTPKKEYKKKCHVATSKRLEANRNKGICKACICYNYLEPCVLNVEFENFKTFYFKILVILAP